LVERFFTSRTGPDFRKSAAPLKNAFLSLREAFFSQLKIKQ
jgi:hypothetical protein